jgi:hypothetical protein
MFRAGLLLALVVVVGCQPVAETPSNLPPLLPLEVTVLQEGKPVSGAFVRLLPPDPNMPWSCGGTTGENGVAVIKTIGEYDGAPEGEYKVVISKLELPKLPESSLSNLDAPPPSTGSEGVNLIDPKYSRPNTTPLKVKVAEGNATASFDVGPAVREKVQGPP